MNTYRSCIWYGARAWRPGVEPLASPSANVAVAHACCAFTALGKLQIEEGIAAATSTDVAAADSTAVAATEGAPLSGHAARAGTGGHPPIAGFPGAPTTAVRVHELRSVGLIAGTLLGLWSDWGYARICGVIVVFGPSIENWCSVEARRWFSFFSRMN